MTSDLRLHVGDALQMMRENIPDGSIQMCVTSPPYWHLRDYGVESQLGNEASSEEYLRNMLAVTAEIKRCLREDGTFWLNIGDTYHGKQLEGIPWRLALAMKDQGWILRQDIIYHKTNAMPESVRNRPSRNHEYFFLFAKNHSYQYDAIASADPQEAGSTDAFFGGNKYGNTSEIHRTKSGKRYVAKPYKMKRSVWSVGHANYNGIHEAIFPDKLITPAVLAATKEGDTVLDPFAGSGTTAIVCKRLNRNCVLIEINEEYGTEIMRRYHES